MEGTEQFASDISKLAPQVEVVEDNAAATEVVLGAEGGQTPPAQEVKEPVVEGQEGGEENEENLSVIQQLQKVYAVDGEFDNTTEGLNSLIAKVAEASKPKAVEELFQSKPVLKELDTHLNAGKSLESFFQVQKVSAEKLGLVPLTGDETNDAKVQAYYKDVMRANLAEKGLPERQINRIVESSELENTLEDDYKESVADWNSRRDAEATRVSESEAQRVADEQAQGLKTLTEINTLVDAGTIGGTIIPAAERPLFKDFLLKQGEDGLAERDRKIANLSTKDFLIIDYLLFKDFKVKGFNATTAGKSLDDVFQKKPVVAKPVEGNAAPSIFNGSFAGLKTQENI